MKKSIGASMLITLGVIVNLLSPYPLAGAIFFSFGLLTICFFNFNLFTGKCGYYIQDKISLMSLTNILFINLFSGFVFGKITAIALPNLVTIAQGKVENWYVISGFEYFLLAAMCGVVMFIAVELNKRSTLFGIFLGVPLFIICGFQHCIANVILLGIANNLTNSALYYLIIAIVGNFIGANFISYLLK